MKNTKKIVLLGLTSFGAISLAGCDWFKKQEPIPFDFSVGLQSGANVIETNSKQKVVVYNNGEDTAGRSYTYTSSDVNVATIDKNGNVTPKKAGRVNFTVKEAKSKLKRALKKEIVVVAPSSKSKGGYNYAGGTDDLELERRAEILGKLEKYAMDTHLTGLTLFDNGGYVRYSKRITELPATEYIQGYGFGILTDGTLTGTLSGKEGKIHPTYYHSAISQDSLKINQYTATGSQVGDLAGHITSSYWGTVLNTAHTDYDWYPLLAQEYVKKPIINELGELEGFESTPTLNSDPIPLEAENSANPLYRKWRVYVKVDGLNYTTASTKTKVKAFNNRAVALKDYMFAYKLLLTGSNELIRGTEMANDTSYGIKGAALYNSATESENDANEINKIWESYITPADGAKFNEFGKLGLKSGVDAVGQSYIDFELINPIDEFTAKYTLSSNLVSPLPESFFIGSSSISDKSESEGQFNDAANIYGTFNGELEDNKILDYTLCLGAYTLTEWKKLQAITFKTNTNWFEKTERNRYKIDGVYYRVYDTSTDSEKLWKQLEAGNLDSAGVPTSKIKEWNKPSQNVFQTKGDSTFKLNVNSCTKAQWEELFGKNGKISKGNKWDVKPWMSNQDFLDGLFYSINRKAFADKRGVTPSVNYFSNAYQMRNSKGGKSYNEYSLEKAKGGQGKNFHEEAVKGYAENYGYNKDKAIQCFRNAVQQLSRLGDKGIVLGTREKPTNITIHIRWMYQTDIKEYGEDIKSYFESAFNDPSVCGGRVKLTVKQAAVTNWEDVYNKFMMKGCFDLGFGAISGNTYNPLNFMEVLKSDNSSNFTLNWGPDTSKVDEKNPIVYDGKKWSFDALWEVADHGGLVDGGEKIDPLKKCTVGRPKKLSNPSENENDLRNGFTLSYDVSFADFSGTSTDVSFDANKLEIYVNGVGSRTLVEKGHEEEGCSIVYNPSTKKITATISSELGKTIDDWIRDKKNFKEPYDPAWHEHPFDYSHRVGLFDFDLYYALTINGTTSINYAKTSK